MRLCLRWCVPCMLLILTLAMLAGSTPAQAQQPQHVVSLDDLNRDAARPAQARQADKCRMR